MSQSKQRCRGKRPSQSPHEIGMVGVRLDVEIIHNVLHYMQGKEMQNTYTT